MSTEQPSNPDREPETDDIWLRMQEHMKGLTSDEPKLSDRQELSERLNARAKTLRQRMARPGTDESRITFLAFNKQQERYGILLDEVAAVESLDNFTPVPNAPTFIRGVAPWRGSIVALLDLGRFFGRPETGIADLRGCVIVETADRRVAVVAYEVEEIVTVLRTDVAAIADLPDEMAPDWVVGVHDENRLILKMKTILQDDRLVDWRK